MIKFRMTKITTDQFAILASEVTTGDIDINIEAGLKYSVEARKIMTTVTFSFEENSRKIILLKVSCEYEIAKEDWEAATSEGKVVIPKSLLEYFMTQTIGVSRGVLHCKTEGTPFNGIILPPIDVTKLVNGDMTIEQ